MNGYSLESTNKTYTILDTRPEVFELFLRWLYQKTASDVSVLVLNTPELDKSPQLEDAPETKREEFVRNTGFIQELWIFGDKYEIPQLQDACVDFQEGLQKRYGLILFPLEYSHTTNKFEDFIIDTCAFYCASGVSWLEAMIETASKHILVKLIAAMGSVKGKPTAKNYYVDVCAEDCVTELRLGSH